MPASGKELEEKAAEQEEVHAAGASSQLREEQALEHSSHSSAGQQCATESAMW
jgi:hypothetical protein